MVAASLPDIPGSFAVKAGFDHSGSSIGLKCGSYWPDNHHAGLPAHGSTILLLDPATGFPACLVSAAYLNGFRTAAANAVAVSSLAREDANILGVIGAGHQAEHEIRAVAEVRDLSLVKIFSRSRQRQEWLQTRLEDLDVEVALSSAEQAARESDIITTVTPATEAIVRKDWVSPGTHISAMGADAVGKQELDSSLVQDAICFADYPAQSRRIGEFQTATNEGRFSSETAITAIGDVILGRARGRVNTTDITIFDSSCIALQDLLVATALFARAKESGLVQTVEF